MDLSSILFICLFFSSFRSLVNISCIFSIFASILYPRSRIIFTIIILNSFSRRLPISTSFSCFSGVLSCPFIWDITFCFNMLVKHFCNVVFILVTVGLWFFLLLLSALWWRRLRRLYKLPDGRDWWWEKLGLALVGKALLSKALIQLSADEWGWAPSLVFFWSEETQPSGWWQPPRGTFQAGAPFLWWAPANPHLLHRKPSNTSSSFGSVSCWGGGGSLLSSESWCTQVFVCAL